MELMTFRHIKTGDKCFYCAKRPYVYRAQFRINKGTMYMCLCQECLLNWEQLEFVKEGE